MNEWLEFLSNQSLSYTVGSSETAVVPMPEHRLLEISGKDAATFLQGQLTCDIRRLDNQDALLGAHCNPKGRVISSFWIAKTQGDAIALRCHASIAEKALATLKKYIVFSKAQLVPSNKIALAILGWKPGQFPALGNIPERGKFSIHNELTVIHHSAGELEVWVAPEQAVSLWQSLAAEAKPASQQLLSRHWVTNGIAEVQAVTSEEFIPQMLNYHLIDGISFKKGCYTGQEIVARMQYRGQLKKHTYQISGDGTVTPAIGTSLALPSAPDKDVAIVVASTSNAVSEKEEPWLGLIVCTNEARETADWLIDKNSGAKFSWTPLPYAIP